MTDKKDQAYDGYRPDMDQWPEFDYETSDLGRDPRWNVWGWLILITLFIFGVFGVIAVVRLLEWLAQFLGNFVG